MARQSIGFGLTLVAISVLWAGAAAQSSSSCTNALISMSPCLNYVTGNSSTPSSGCCTQLKNVVTSDPQCLCEALNGGSSMGITVNQTRALELPGYCKVQTPSISKCNGASPTNTPSGTPATPTRKTPTTSSGTGSTDVPSTDSSSSPSNASSTKMTISLSFVLLFVVSYFSTSTIC